MLRLICVIGCAALLLAGPVGAATTRKSGGSGAPPSAAELDIETQRLMTDVLDLEAGFDTLEANIRYPAATRWTVFVTSAYISDFVLKELRLKVDGAATAEHQYDDSERSALERSGAQRLHIGNLQPGRHRLSTDLRGSLNGQPYTRTQFFTIDKTDGPRLLELHLATEVAPTDAHGGAGPGVIAHQYSDTP